MMINLLKTILKKKIKNKKQLADFKRIWAKKYQKDTPRNSEIISAYRKLLKEGKIKKDSQLEEILRLRKIRSLSGIVPVAVLTKPYPCPGECIYCPTQENMPKSYLNDEPAVMRAKMANFDPYKQVSLRLKQLQNTGHSTQKIELIVMGGTFSSLPIRYQTAFITKCFMAANKAQNAKRKTPAGASSFASSSAKAMEDKKAMAGRQSYKTKLKTLNEKQTINETAKNRIVGLTLETRPDEITPELCRHFRKLGCTRVEIGVQSIYDRVLKKVKRGHDVKAVIEATQLLKDAGFKVCYHLMPNLPGSNPQKDLKMFKTIFKNLDFCPDMIKIYPCVVTYQAELYDWYKKGEFKPYTEKQLVNLLIKIKRIVPQWVRINRVGRDIPAGNIAAGSKLSNIRQVVQKEMKKKYLKCQCIRCREVRNFTLINKSIKFSQLKYQASKGKEYFFSFKDQDNRLYSMLRLRIPSSVFLSKNHFIETLNNAGILREVHTFGLSLPLKSKDKKASQHKGLGKKLIQKAEEKTREKGLKKICVISGVGTREYYRKLGYQLENTYMVKRL